MNAPDLAAKKAVPSGTQQLYPVRLAVADYDRTRPLIYGQVKAEGIALDVTPRLIGEFCARPVYEEYDAAEMSMSWYVAARARGEPVVALPIFPLRMPVFAYILCRKGAAHTHPRDLVGKRVGAGRYRWTVNLWLRGIFREHYGVNPQDFTWVTCGEEEAGFRIPRDVKVEVNEGARPEELLASGRVDALLTARLSDDFLAGKTDFRRLFPDARAEMRSMLERTGIVPITHVIVMSEALYKREPWVAVNLTHAFMEAQRACDGFWLECAKHLSFPEAVFFLEEQRAVYGEEPWSHGLARNRHIIETFVRYAHEQGYIDRRLGMEELFAGDTLTL